MNICFVSDVFDPPVTGVGINAQIAAEELAKRGHNITVITSRGKGQLSFESRNGIRIYRVFSIKYPFHGIYLSFPSQGSIKKILQQNHIEILHFHSISFLTQQAFRASKGLNLKTVYTYNTFAEHYSKNSLLGKVFSSYIKNSIAQICNQCDCVTVPSIALIPEVRKSSIRSHIHYLSNVVAFQTSAKQMLSIRKRRFTVLYVGRLNVEKNVFYLIRAFSLFLKQCNNAELWIIGEGVLNVRLQNLSSKLGIANNVKFLGYLPNHSLPAYYSACDVFVLPSLFEVQSLVMLEAMQFGKPIICSKNIVSATELVDNGKSGFLIDNQVPGDLAGKLEILYKDEKLRKKMGIVSKRKSRDFGSDKIITKLEMIYAKIKKGLIETRKNKV